MLDADSTSFCCVHKKECRLCSATAETARSEHGAAATVPEAPQAWWEKPEDWTKDALGISEAGVPCIDWTALGKQKGAAGLTERWHHVWQVDREMAATLKVEQLYFAECAATYPVHDKQTQGMAASHHVLSIVVSPHHLGFPVRRERCLSAGLCKDSLVWCGPDERRLLFRISPVDPAC